MRAPLQLLSMRRVVGMVSISVAISILATFGTLMFGVNQRVSRGFAEFARKRSKQRGASCRASPQSWSLMLPSGTKVFAYDVETFRSAHPKAPPIPPSLRRAIRRGARRANTRFPMFQGGSTHVFRVAAKGPCSLLSLRWNYSSSQRLSTIIRLTSIMALGILLCLWLSYRWIARPLLRRIQDLAHLARHTGRQEAPAQWPPPLDDDLGVIERSLHQAHQQILEDKRALRAKHQALREHLADIAHDLRTPITSLQLVLERASQQNQGSQELLAAMADAVYMEQLTNNLGLATQLEEGLWDPQQCQLLDLCELLQRIFARFRVLAREKGVDLAHAYPDGPTLAVADAVLLERALSNLTYNAIHHNHSGGHVSLLLLREPERFRFKVMDDGPGIPPAEIPELSLRHSRSSSARERNTAGLGLGLSITAEVCRRMGWELEFESLSPQGLCVQISGPLSEENSKETNT